MAYQVIARKWRPMLFEDVIGQEHITTTLKNAIKTKRVAHAYIFSGPRGVGKTTTARILAKALNCENGPTPQPCNQCSSCVDITRGASIDVLEIDGASNNGVDEVRNLRDKIRFTPTSGKYKIYIIDEVHMLSTQAFNALLKTLEEPPEHAIFIFATTEIHKVLPTILSRCQRYDFKSIPVRQIVGRLEQICQSENIKISREALLEIAVKADGGMRDAQSLLDQVISFSGNDIEITQVRQALGLIDRELFFNTSDYIYNNDSKSLLALVRRINLDGFDLGEFLIGLEEHFRNFLVSLITKSTSDLDISENYKKKYEERKETFCQADLLKYIQLIQDVQMQIKKSFQPKLKLELLLIKMAQMPSSTTIEEILAWWQSNKKKTIVDNAPNEAAVQKPSKQIHNKATETNAQNIIKAEAPEQKNTELEEAESVKKTVALEDIKNIWQKQISNFINEKKTFLANQMSLGLPVSYSGNGIIQIGFSGEHKFAADHIQKNAKLLERLFEDEILRSVRVETIEHKFAEEEKPKTSLPGSIRFDDILEKSPLIQEIIDTFDCKLVRINPKNNGNN